MLIDGRVRACVRACSLPFVLNSFGTIQPLLLGTVLQSLHYSTSPALHCVESVLLELRLLLRALLQLSAHPQLLDAHEARCSTPAAQHAGVQQSVLPALLLRAVRHVPGGGLGEEGLRRLQLLLLHLLPEDLL